MSFGDGKTRARLGARTFGAMAAAAAFAGCARAEPEASSAWSEATPSGYILAPTTTAAAIDASAQRVALTDAEADAAWRTTRNLPPEPLPPPRSASCARETLCREQEEEAPPIAYPAPYERCADAFGKSTNPARFSVAETRSARLRDPTTCCYVEFRGCALQPLTR